MQRRIERTTIENQGSANETISQEKIAKKVFLQILEQIESGKSEVKGFEKLEELTIKLILLELKEQGQDISGEKTQEEVMEMSDMVTDMIFLKTSLMPEYSVEQIYSSAKSIQDIYNESSLSLPTDQEKINFKLYLLEILVDLYSQKTQLDAPFKKLSKLGFSNIQVTGLVGAVIELLEDIPKAPVLLGSPSVPTPEYHSSFLLSLKKQLDAVVPPAIEQPDIISEEPNVEKVEVKSFPKAQEEFLAFVFGDDAFGYNLNAVQGTAVLENFNLRVLLFDYFNHNYELVSRIQKSNKQIGSMNNYSVINYLVNTCFDRISLDLSEVYEGNKVLRHYLESPNLSKKEKWAAIIFYLLDMLLGEDSEFQKARREFEFANMSKKFGVARDTSEKLKTKKDRGAAVLTIVKYLFGPGNILLDCSNRVKTGGKLPGFAVFHPVDVRLDLLVRHGWKNPEAYEKVLEKIAEQITQEVNSYVLLHWGADSKKLTQLIFSAFYRNYVVYDPSYLGI